MNAYEYEEEEYTGLSLKKIGYFFKKGWLNMLIAMLIALCVAAIVALPIKYFYKTEQQGKTSIEFVYDGVEKGLAPNGGVINSDNIISTTVLDNAVKSAELDDIITNISDLRAAMRVEGIPTSEYLSLTAAAANGNADAINRLRDYVMHPTQFDIIISNPKRLGLSDSQTKILLDKIVTAYYDDFKDRYSITGTFAPGTFTLSEDENLEFADIYDQYSASLDSVEIYFNALLAENPKIASGKFNTSFDMLMSDLERLKISYESYNTSLLTNNIWRNKTAAVSSLTEKKMRVTYELDNLNAYIASLGSQIDKFEPNTTVSDGNGSHVTTISYPEKYYELQTRLDESNRKALEYSNQLSNIERRIANIKPDETTPQEVIDKASADLKTLETATEEFMEKVYDTIADYDDIFVSSSVRQVRSSVVTRKTDNFNVLIVFACAALAGLLVGGVWTGVKIYKVNRRNEAAKAAAEKAEAAAPAQNAEATDNDNGNDVTAKKSKKADK